MKMMVNLLPVLIGLIGGLLLFLTQDTSMLTVVYPTITPVSILTAKYIIEKRLKQVDKHLLNIVAGLCTVGMIMLVRLSISLAGKQFIWLIISLTIMVALVYCLPPITVLQKYRYLAIIIGIISLIVTVVFGVTAGGATSWISFGVIRFQPAELVKIFLVLFLASYLCQYREVLAEGTWIVKGYSLPHPRYLGPVVAMWGLSILLLVSQRDLGTALLFFCTFLVMIYIATGRKTYVLAGLILLLIGAILAYFVFGHVRVRINTWLNPWIDIDRTGYQITQSLFAIAWGGFMGVGLGLGNPNLIPAVATDFIFAAFLEENGFLGGCVLIGLYMFLFFIGFRIALRCKDEFDKLFIAGLTSLLVIQTFVILGGVTKLIPLTGITLPFISYGGSSLLTNFVIVALLLRVSDEGGELNG